MPNRTRKETEPEAKLAAPMELTDAELDAVAAAGSQTGSTTDGRHGASHVHIQPFGSNGAGTIQV